RRNMQVLTQSERSYVCPHCDALQTVPEFKPGYITSCVSCGSTLFKSPVNGIEKSLALVITSIILFIVANSYPIMSLNIAGNESNATLTDSALIFVEQGNSILAATVWLPTVLIPGAIIFGLFYILVSIYYDLRWPYTKFILVWVSRLLPWGMMDVFFLGILVALVKLVALADVLLGTGFYAFLALIFTYAATIATLEPYLLWIKLDDHYDQQHEINYEDNINRAKNLGLAGCHTCGLVVELLSQSDAVCPRCHSKVYYRKQNSLTRTWALLISAFIMYIPANTEPIMFTTSLGAQYSSTIMGGVQYFLSHNEWHLAIVIFIASVLIPLAKMISIGYILIMINLGKTRHKIENTRLYMLAELIGKWSMVDVFVVALMSALVQVGAITTIEPGPAGLAFAAVVILTMFAAMSFDPKLIWDQE
ncbi:MAG: paraquat-inducible protein A, partial [Thiohalomonadales bacterium]